MDWVPSLLLEAVFMAHEISEVFGVIDIFVCIQTLKCWVMIRGTKSQFSSFIRVAFDTAAVPFVFLGASGIQW